MPYSAATLDFLFENKMQNSRQWYQEHKPDYQELVVKPTVALIMELAPAMEKIDDQITIDPKRMISRVHRDMRRVRDGILYRSNIWFVFARGKRSDVENPAFYFEFSPEGFSYGCGCYMAGSAYMEQYRSMILTNDILFQQARDALEGQRKFAVGGDCYKRSKFPNQPEELRYYLDRKGLYATHTSKDFDLLFSDKLADTLKRDFKKIAPLYHFMMAVAERTPRKDDGASRSGWAE